MSGPTPSPRLAGRTAYISGAASGIGRATALRMAAEGARLALIDVSGERLEELVGEIGGLAAAFTADILSGDDRARALAAALATVGAPDILVNCVGGSTGLPKPDLTLADMSEEQWDAMIGFNLKSTFLCCHDLIPHMKRKGGSIINLSSISGRGITPQSGVAYATAKAGLVGFTRRLAVELAPAGIRCNAVAPGYVMTERIRANLWEPADAARRAAMIDHIPVGRFAEPEEIATIIAFLASDEASYLTGITVDCNGGIVSP